MRRYPERWRFNENILSKVKAFHRKSRDIVIDRSWKLAKQVVLKVLKHGYAIALKNLNSLRENTKNKSGEDFRKFTMFTYRRLQHSIISKAIEYGVPIVIINPRNTSSTCPKRGEKLTYIHRLAVCKKCRFKGDIDSLGAMNIRLRALQAYAGMPGSPLRASAMDEPDGAGEHHMRG